jgi:anhydro-N-acetylmuramic acid kinase
MSTYKGIGVMSGTSHDGLDLAACTFIQDEKWSYSIEHAVTIPYTDEWKNRLMGLLSADEKEIEKADLELGALIGKEVHNFIHAYSFIPDFVSSHGHTIFHQPDRKKTRQIGNGQAIADACGIKVVNDFRTQDVEMGGQGAPLVPIGDKLLFGEYDFCLNLGGIANISYEKDGNRIAYDICPVNMVLNMLAERMGKPYDDGGWLAQSGEPIGPLIAELESLPFYYQSPPKSLGREWVEENVFPLLQGEDTRDLLSSFVQHIVMRIAEEVYGQEGNMLVTGGGAYNTFLIFRLADSIKPEISRPGKMVIDYKEALIFAFLGLLRLQGINNVLASVTGAPEDHCSGQIHLPK